MPPQYQLTSAFAPLIAFLQFAIVITLTLLLNKLIDKLTSIDDSKELYDNENPSYLLQRVGPYLVPFFGCIGTVGRFDLWRSLPEVLGSWCVAALVTVVTYCVSDLALGQRPTKPNDMPNVPLSVAWTKLGFYVVAAFATAGVLGGGGAPDNQTEVRVNAVILALTILVAAPLAFHLMSAISPAKLVTAIRDGNVTAGVVAASYLAVIGEIIMAATWGFTFNVSTAVISFTIAFLSGIVVTAIAARVVDRFDITGNDDDPSTPANEAKTTDRTLRTIIDQRQRTAGAKLAIVLAFGVGPLAAWMIHLLFTGYLS